MKNIYISVLFIVLIGFFLRFYGIQEKIIWGSEQSLSVWPIVRMFEEKKLPLIGVHLFNYKSALFRPPFFIYLFALPLKIFHFDPLVLEVIFSLIGTICILIIYLTGKKIFNKQVGLISAFLYSISSYIIKTDKIIWTITPIIITSALITYFFGKFLSKNNSSILIAFIIGCLVGLGFSFHFQIAVIFISIFVILFKKSFKHTLIYFLGFLLLLAPLLIFNFRHNFIMLNGIKNLIYGEQVIVRQNTNLAGKFNNGLNAYSDLVLSIFNINPVKLDLPVNILIFLIFLLLPSYWIHKQNHMKSRKMFAQYFILCCIFGVFGLAIIDQGFYTSTAFYLWFLIPLLILVWGNFLVLLLKTKLKFIILLLLVLFFIKNVSLILAKPATDYLQNIKIIDYILKQAQGKPFSIKFINRDVLVYDYLFYYRAPKYNLNFNQINLIEQWQPGQANFYLIHGEYDWDEDRYKISPYESIFEFNGVKTITKTQVEQRL